MSAKVIFHIDINAFFASAHIALDPSLQGKPVAACHVVKGFVVTSASYEARKRGVKSAMLMTQAKLICPELIVVHVDFDLYEDLSQKFIDLITSYSPLVEPGSVDEVYVDFTETIKNYKRPLDLAIEIQKRVYEELKLPVNIGIAPNKFLAKMGSDMNKPLGITVIRKREVEAKIWPLPIEDMFGIGRKTVPRLHKVGIFTIGDLANAPFGVLRNIFGNRTQIYIDLATGTGSDIIDTDTTAKSIGHSLTYSKPIHELDELKTEILNQIIDLEKRAKDTNVKAKTIQFAIRFEDMITVARSLTLDYYINDKEDIFERVMGLYTEFEGKHEVSGVKFLSVSLSNIKSIDQIEEQLSLFTVNKKTNLSKSHKKIKRSDYPVKTDIVDHS